MRHAETPARPMTFVGTSGHPQGQNCSLGLNPRCDLKPQWSAPEPLKVPLPRQGNLLRSCLLALVNPITSMPRVPESFAATIPITPLTSVRALERSRGRQCARLVRESIDRQTSSLLMGHGTSLASRDVTSNSATGMNLTGLTTSPTSSHAEARFIRQPVNQGQKAPMRSKIYQNILPDRNMTPFSSLPYSPARVDYVPSFARDTAASRIARETSLAHRAPSARWRPLTTQRVAQLAARSNLNPHVPQATVRSRKTKKPLQLKPHLISNLNPPKESKGRACYVNINPGLRS